MNKIIILFALIATMTNAGFVSIAHAQDHACRDSDLMVNVVQGEVTLSNKTKKLINTTQEKEIQFSKGKIVTGLHTNGFTGNVIHDALDYSRSVVIQLSDEWSNINGTLHVAPPQAVDTELVFFVTHIGAEFTGVDCFFTYYPATFDPRSAATLTVGSFKYNLGSAVTTNFVCKDN